MSYATNSRNVDTISIECCHPDETGQFNTATYDSAVKLTAWLCTRFGLTSDQVIRHYDVTGKDCPKYYVEKSRCMDPDEIRHCSTDPDRLCITGEIKVLLFIL